MITQAVQILHDDAGGWNYNVELYWLEDENDIKMFQNDHNCGNVRGAVEKVNEILDEGKMWWICDVCEQKIYENGHYSSYTGDGGIGISQTDMICHDCYSGGLCYKCDEYYGREELKRFDEDELLCEYCFPIAVEDQKKAEERRKAFELKQKAKKMDEYWNNITEAK